jgi:hypothetical protein
VARYSSWPTPHSKSSRWIRIDAPNVSEIALRCGMSSAEKHWYQSQRSVVVRSFVSLVSRVCMSACQRVCPSAPARPLARWSKLPQPVPHQPGCPGRPRARRIRLQPSQTCHPPTCRRLPGTQATRIHSRRPSRPKWLCACENNSWGLGTAFCRLGSIV